MKKHNHIYWLLLTVALFWGTSYVAAKLGLQDLLPLNLGILRFTLAALLFSGILLVKKQFHIDRQDIPSFFVLGLMAISLFYFVHYTALQYTTSTNAGLLMAASPVFVTLLCVLSRKEKVTGCGAAGVFIAFIGVLLVITRGDISTLYRSGGTLFGDGLVALNALMWAWVTLRGKYVLEKYSPFAAMAYIHIFGALQLLPFAFFTTPVTPLTLGQQLGSVSAMTIGVVVYLAVFCSGYSYGIWYYGVAKLGAVKTAAFNYFNPVIASLAGYAVFGESLSIFILLGGGLVILGVYLTNHSKREKVAVSSALPEKH